MRAAPLVGLAAATALAAAILAGALHATGGEGPLFGLAAAWAPMLWLGALSHVRAFRLTAGFHALRPFERERRLYERLGVRVAKRLLRRGPAALWNPGLRLPRERSPEALAALDARMQVAEASHALAFLVTLALAASAAARGRWGTAGWALLFDGLVNGYPLLLQRYNRALLAERA